MRCKGLVMEPVYAQQIECGGATRLWLSQPQWLSLLKQVEDHRQQQGRLSTYEGPERRDTSDPRRPIRMLCALRIQDSHRSLTYQAPCQDISAGGIGLILPEAVNKGARCTMAIRQDQGPGIIASGRIAWCRPCTEQLYEMGVQFDAPIDPTMILGQEQLGA